MIRRNFNGAKITRVFCFILAAASWPTALASAAGDSDARDCADQCMTVNNGGAMTYGSGRIKTEVRQVENFTSIRLSVPATLSIERTGEAGLKVTAEDNLLPLLESEVKDGTLRLSLARRTSFTGKIPVFEVTVTDLRGLQVEGSGIVKASKLDGSALSLTVAGSGEIDLAGRSDLFTVAISGSGSVDAAELQAKRAKVGVTGSGDVVVNASDELDATVTGPGQSSTWDRRSFRRPFSVPVPSSKNNRNFRDAGRARPVDLVNSGVSGPVHRRHDAHRRHGASSCSAGPSSSQSARSITT